MKIIDFSPLDSTYGNPRQAYAQLLHTNKPWLNLGYAS